MQASSENSPAPPSATIRRVLTRGAAMPNPAGGLFTVVFEGVGPLPANLDALPLHAIHRYTAITLFAFIALHVAGALFHQFILRDHLLSRMGFSTPWSPSAREEKKDVATEGGRAGG